MRLRSLALVAGATATLMGAGCAAYYSARTQHKQQECSELGNNLNILEINSLVGLLRTEVLDVHIEQRAIREALRKPSFKKTPGVTPLSEFYGEHGFQDILDLDDIETKNTKLHIDQVETFMEMQKQRPENIKQCDGLEEHYYLAINLQILAATLASIASLLVGFAAGSKRSYGLDETMERTDA